jgi:hypothetical protein
MSWQQQIVNAQVSVNRANFESNKVEACRKEYCLQEIEAAIQHLKVARYSLKRITSRKNKK